jgi:hypothetical protein
MALYKMLHLRYFGRILQIALLYDNIALLFKSYLTSPLKFLRHFGAMSTVLMRQKAPLEKTLPKVTAVLADKLSYSLYNKESLVTKRLLAEFLLF